MKEEQISHNSYKWKANYCTANKITSGKYWQIGLAEDKYDFENYILFQKPYQLNKDEDPEAEHNQIYAETNGSICFNKIESIVITDTVFEAKIDGAIFEIDITNAKINNRFITYAQLIFEAKISVKILKP